MSRTIFARPGIGATARILQHGEQEMVRMPMDHAVLIMVRQGSKILRWQGRECLIKQGEAVAIAAGQVLDVTNLRPHEGVYESVWLNWQPELIEQYAADYGHARDYVRDVLPIGTLPAAFNLAYDGALAALSDAHNVPDAIARHRLTEMLLWLAGQGVHFRPGTPVTLHSRIRGLIAAAPADAWNGPALAAQLAMSEATLRRRLAGEGMSLSELLIDVRMSYALTLLQSTDRPVSQIALDAGYESPSRFAIRFRKRFGFAPTAIRGHQRTFATGAVIA
ncbi:MULTISPECIES: helix-turn-helix transcriptional regulator [Silvimonas]|uniref:helix-turn-helix transcriptional regulator n=1 Tax=Silvimonas TaxID=300264 RepID=UPI0024B341D8|nr:MULTISPECIES: AraC family transcriptional regulator [Silvimonas]MDR3428265.1 AraC family transcriptional regulator [Silvimonas sp.]